MGQPSSAHYYRVLNVMTDEDQAYVLCFGNLVEFNCITVGVLERLDGGGNLIGIGTRKGSFVPHLYFGPVTQILSNFHSSGWLDWHRNETRPAEEGSLCVPVAENNDISKSCVLAGHW